VACRALPLLHEQLLADTPSRRAETLRGPADGDSSFVPIRVFITVDEICENEVFDEASSDGDY
jgi:hypothetical protein